MTISLSTLFVLTAIVAIVLASVTVDPILGLGLGVIILPTVIGLLIASLLPKRHGNAMAGESTSNESRSNDETKIGLSRKNAI